ncbi:MAG: DUF4416 family protein [Candidatus Auribacterota bacterium]
MGIEKSHPPVILICGILAANRILLDRALHLIQDEWGPLISSSENIPFTFTEYYNKEMGTEIIRQYVCFERMIDPVEIFGIKRRSNQLEQRFISVSGRQVNLDPGYVTLAKLVLATTKDASYRIYGGNGIYAETTLYFKAGTFCPFEWTYPDYEEQFAIDYFNSVRAEYKSRLNQLKA